MFKPRNPFPDAQTSRIGPRPVVAARGIAPRRRGRLLRLLRKLIHHGNDQLAIVRESPPLDQLYRIGQGFGTRDIAMIMARIVRGLRIATELEDRIVNCAANLNRPRTPQRASVPTPEPAAISSAQARHLRMELAEHAPPPASKPQEDLDVLLRHWPTSKEIAARVRGRPIGSVLAEICRDLGVGYSHPMWWEVLDAIDQHGGNYAHFTRVRSNRRPSFDLFQPDRGPVPPSLPEWPPMSSPVVAEAGTSPQ